MLYGEDVSDEALALFGRDCGLNVGALFLGAGLELGAGSPSDFTMIYRLWLTSDWYKGCLQSNTGV